jgi:hypothetical protein
MLAAWIEDFPGPNRPSSKSSLRGRCCTISGRLARRRTRHIRAQSKVYVVEKAHTPAESPRFQDAAGFNSHESGLRLLPLIAAMFYSFARVSAVLKLKVDDLLS